MRETEKFRKLLDERGVKWWEGWDKDLTTFDGANGVRYQVDCTLGKLFIRSILSITPEQAVAATVGNERLAFLEEKVKRQGEYIVKLAKEKKALFAQNCEAATRYAGQMDYMQRKLEAATLGPKTAKRVVTTNPETDGATGRCYCGACGKSIDPSDNFCRRCGARLED